MAVIKHIKSRVRGFPAVDRSAYGLFLAKAKWLVETMLNPETAGFHIDQHIPPMSVAKFRKVYTIILCYFVVLGSSDLDSKQQEHLSRLTSIATDAETANRAFSELSSEKDDIDELGRRAWDRIADVIEYDGGGLTGVFKGAFIVLARARWREIERRVARRRP